MAEHNYEVQVWEPIGEHKRLTLLVQATNLYAAKREAMRALDLDPQAVERHDIGLLIRNLDSPTAKRHKIVVTFDCLASVVFLGIILWVFYITQDPLIFCMGVTGIFIGYTLKELLSSR